MHLILTRCFILLGFCRAKKVSNFRKKIHPTGIDKHSPPHQQLLLYTLLAPLRFSFLSSPLKKVTHSYYPKWRTDSQQIPDSSAEDSSQGAQHTALHLKGCTLDPCLGKLTPYEDRGVKNLTAFLTEVAHADMPTDRLSNSFPCSFQDLNIPSSLSLLS